MMNGKTFDRRSFMKSAAVAGGVAAASAALPGGRSAVAAAVKPAACKEIPNKYNEPFCVNDDELLIFAVNYKPFESSVTSDRQAYRVFNTIIGDKLQAKFPDVKVKYATWDYPIRYEDLEAAGVVPDIIIDDPRSRIARDLKPRGWVQDMTALIQQAGIDLSTLNQGAVELVKSRSYGGFCGVPIFVDENILFYNKKIFDKFKVHYPTPGMTYDDAFALTKKLTRQTGLDAYKGYMQHPDNYLAFNQAGLYPFLSTGTWSPTPDQIKVSLTSRGWQDLGRNLERFLEIPRNTFTTVDDYLKGDMSRPGHVAMAVNSLHMLPTYALNELYINDGDEDDFKQWASSVDIGVSAVPVLGKGDSTIYQPDTRAAFVPPQSTKQDAAMQIVQWLVSEEAQIEFSKWAIKGVLETKNVVDSFAVNVPELAKIDTSAVYWGKNAVVHDYQYTNYWDIPLYAVFRQHVLKDCMTVESGLTVAEQTDIPAYIKAQAAAGLNW